MVENDSLGSCAEAIVLYLATASKSAEIFYLLEVIHRKPARSHQGPGTHYRECYTAHFAKLYHLYCKTIMKPIWFETSKIENESYLTDVAHWFHFINYTQYFFFLSNMFSLCFSCSFAPMVLFHPHTTSALTQLESNTNFPNKWKWSICLIQRESSKEIRCPNCAPSVKATSKAICKYSLLSIFNSFTSPSVCLLLFNYFYLISELFIN